MFYEFYIPINVLTCFTKFPLITSRTSSQTRPIYVETLADIEATTTRFIAINPVESFVTSYMCYKKSKDNEHILCGIFSIYVMLPHAYIIFIAKLKLYSFIFIDELRYTETSSSFNCHISYFILIFSKVVCTSRLDFLYSYNMTLS